MISGSFDLGENEVIIGKGIARNDIVKIIHYAILLLHFSDKRDKANKISSGNPTAFSVDYDK